MQRIVQDERILIDAEEEMLGWKSYIFSMQLFWKFPYNEPQRFCKRRYINKVQLDMKNFCV